MRWVCFAEDPLPMEELRHAMMFDEETTLHILEDYRNLEAYTETDEQMKRVINLSEGLLEVADISSQRQSNNEKCQMAQFIHQWVKDCFVTKGLTSLSGSSPAHVFGQAHSYLLRACSRFMTLQDISRFYLPADFRENTTRVDSDNETHFLLYILWF